MDIRVSGHQVDTGAAFEAHAEERLSAIVDKYFSRALTSHVTLGKAPHGGFRCDIVTHVAQGLILKGSAVAQDAHIALDQSAEKIEKQLRRYKRRITARQDQADPTPGARKMRLTPCSWWRRPRPRSRSMHRWSLPKRASMCPQLAFQTRS